MEQNAPENRPGSSSELGSPEEKRLVIFSTTVPQLALYVALFMVFTIISWGVIVWNEVTQSNNKNVYDIVFTVITNGGQAALSAVVLTVVMVFIGNWVRTARRWIAKR